MKNKTLTRALKSTAVTLSLLMVFDAIAVPIAQASVHQKPTPASIVTPTPTFNSEPFRVPASVGSIIESYAPSRTGRMVYHLQDVHDHVPAQINMAEIVSLLEDRAAKEGKRLVVAIEGASGVVESDAFAKLPNQKSKEDVGAGLLRAGYLHGEEYAAITHAPGRIKLIGVENEGLYQQNVRARTVSKEARENVLSTLQETHEQLEKLVPHNFNSLLTRLEKMRAAVEEGTLALSEYVNFLKSINPGAVARHPAVARMAALSATEAGIDFDAVDKEGKTLVEDLMVELSDKQIDQMLTDAQAMREGRLSSLSYYSLLLGKANKDYPVIKQYVAYLRAAEAIDTDQLFDEVLSVEKEIAKGLVKHQIAMNLYDHLRWVEQQEWFFSLSMIPQDWANQKSVEASAILARHAAIRSFVSEQVGDLGYRFATPDLNLRDLMPAYAGARTFYEAAAARDIAMVENLDKILNGPDGRNAVVAFIAGGFHTPGMTKLFRNRGLAYEVIRPMMETEVELSQSVSLPKKRVDYLRSEPGLENPAVQAAIENPSSAADVIKKPDPRKGINTNELLLGMGAFAVLVLVALNLYKGGPTFLTVIGIISVMLMAAISLRVLDNRIEKEFAAKKAAEQKRKEEIREAQNLPPISQNGIELESLSTQNVLRAMVEEAADMIGRPLSALSDPAILEQAVNEFNVQKGGLRPVIEGRTLEDISPTHIPILEEPKNDVNFINDFGNQVEDGELAWMVSGGGVSTRMKLPKQFGVLGTTGLTPAILKLLQARGYDIADNKGNVPSVVVDEELQYLIDRAASGIVDTADDLSFGQRNLLQLMYQSHDWMDDIRPRLDKLTFIVTVNSVNRSAIQNQLAALKFPGKIYVIEQPEVGGLTFPNKAGEMDWKVDQVYPEGHGEPFIAMVRRHGGTYQLDSNRRWVELDAPLQEVLLENGVKKLFFGQGNDLNYLSDMASVDRFEAAQKGFDLGAEMVLEMVANNIPQADGSIGQKGGGFFKKSNSKTSKFGILRDTLAMKSPEFKDFEKPKSISRMAYVLDLKALGKLDWKSIPRYLALRKDDKKLSTEYYSGDASSVLNAVTMEKAGQGINTIKERVAIGKALSAVEQQDKQLGFDKLWSRDLGDDADVAGPGIPLFGVEAGVSMGLLAVIFGQAPKNLAAYQWSDLALSAAVFAVLTLMTVITYKFFPKKSQRPAAISAVSYDQKATPPLLAKPAEIARKWAAGFKKILQRKNLATSVKEPAFVAINADSFGNDISGVFELLAEMDQAVSPYLSSKGTVVVNHTGDNIALELAAQKKFKGISVVVVSAGENADIDAIFKAAASKISLSNITPNNSYLLSLNRKNEKDSNDPRNVTVQGVPHLFLATFAYAYTKQGAKVLDEMVDLYAEFYPEMKLDGSLTEAIRSAILAAIGA